mgnify:CR=1 FL=1
MDTEKLRQEAIELRKEKHQMIKTELNAELNDGHDLAIVYTPGVSAPCLAIKDDEDLSLTMTWRGNVVAVISDGTRVVGGGDVGAAASRPVLVGYGAVLRIFG